MATIPQVPEQVLGTEESQDSEVLAPDYGEKNENLPEELQQALKSVVKHFQGLDKYARRCEVIEARRQRFYWRDEQYIVWSNASMAFAPVTGGASVQLGSASVDMPRYTEVYNIYMPFGRSIVSVLMQNPPGCRFEADDFKKPSDIAAAEAAEKFKNVIDRANDRKAVQADIARFFWTDGRVVLWTKYVENASKYGVNEDGTPKGAEEISVHGVLESKLPITAKNRDKCTYVILSEEIDIVDAKDEYPDAASQIKEGTSSTGESAYERIARLGVLQGTRQWMQAGDSYAHLVTRHTCFLRPQCFEKAPDAYKDQLKELFSEGCTVVFCGDAYCESRNETMDDHLAIGFPLPGDGMNRKSMGSAMVPIQDSFNDLMNLRKEIYDYCLPSTWMDSEIGDIDALREQISEPGNHVSASRPTGIPMANLFYQEEGAQVPPDLLEALKELAGQLPQFVTGALPALFGGKLEDNDTASGYAMARDQAMGQMGLPWGSMQELYAQAYKQAVMCAAKNRPEGEKVSISSEDERGSVVTEELAIADLQKGNFHSFPDIDTSFPETFGSKRQTYMNLMTMAAQSPELTETLMQPDNLELGKQLIGLEDLVIPGAEARNKQLREIDQLLKEGPIPPSPEELQQFAEANAVKNVAQQTAGVAMPPPPPPGPKPSVEVDPVMDLHKYEFEECQRWINSDEGQNEKLVNPAGFMNVRLHAMEHYQLVQAMMAPPPLPAPPPKAA